MDAVSLSGGGGGSGGESTEGDCPMALLGGLAFVGGGCLCALVTVLFLLLQERMLSRYMGAVDRSDQNISMVRLKRAFKRWSQAALFRLLDVGLTNAAALHSHFFAQAGKHASSRLFYEQAVKELLSNYGGVLPVQRLSLKAAQPRLAKTRNKALSHTPTLKGTRGRCGFCYGDSEFWCKGCPETPSLCQHCSPLYHQMLAEEAAGADPNLPAPPRLLYSELSEKQAYKVKLYKKMKVLMASGGSRKSAYFAAKAALGKPKTQKSAKRKASGDEGPTASQSTEESQ